MKLTLTGSIAYDYLMTFPGHFRDHILPDKLDSISLSFLVDGMVKRRGGVAPNIAYTLSLLGQRPLIFGSVGEDFAAYQAWLEEQGVDVSEIRVIPDEFTASFFANTDRDNNQIASFYPGAMGYDARLSLADLAETPDLVVISPTDPGAMVSFVEEAQSLKIPYLYDPSQQLVRLEGDDIRRGVEGALGMCINDYEFSLVQKSTAMTPQEIVDSVQFLVVTRGEEGATVYADGDEHHIPTVPPSDVVDPTGVGDAFRGGFLTGFSHGLDWVLCGQMGALAATYCLETDSPQSHHYTIAEYVARFREHFDDEKKLDILSW
ncbi:MAG: Adenosine kinase [Chloroflexi bacterium]|nr:Adenosine kinase [Chloroflexota bacterium]